MERDYEAESMSANLWRNLIVRDSHNGPLSSRGESL